jgi:adhesin transport system outer membrane protein
MRKSVLVLVLSSLYTTLSAQTLQTSVQHALISNPNILENKAKSLAASQAVRSAEGAYLPSVDVNLGLGKEQTDNPITNAIGGASSNVPMTRKESSIELTQNLFSGFALTGEAQRQYHLWRAQEYKTLGIAEDLSLAVTERYLDVLKNQQLFMLARENLHEHQRLFGMIETRAGAGVSRQAELEQAKSRLALANANYLSVENDLRDARVSFMRLTGEAAHHLLWPQVPSNRVLPRSLPVAIQKALDNHPTLLSAHADILEAKAQHKVAKSSDYPKIDLRLRAAQNRNLDGLIGQNNEKLALVSLSYNIFRGGTDLAKKRETAYQVQEAYEVKNNTVLQIEEKMRLSWYAWLTAGKRLRYLRTHVNAAYETRLAYAEQFKVGKRTLLDLLDSQNEYYQAKIERENGHFDEVFTRFRILNGEGALLRFLKGKLPTGVHNDDFATSHEKVNHNWLEKPLEAIPDVDLTDNKLTAKKLDLFKHPNLPKHKTSATTKAPAPLFVKTWFVYAKKFQSAQQAQSLTRRLKRMGMEAAYSRGKDGFTWVYLGPYSYRSQAGLAMNRLQKRAKITGSIAVRNKRLDPALRLLPKTKPNSIKRAITLSKKKASPQTLLAKKQIKQKLPNTQTQTTNKKRLTLLTLNKTNKTKLAISTKKQPTHPLKLTKKKNINQHPMIKKVIHKKNTPVKVTKNKIIQKPTPKIARKKSKHQPLPVVVLKRPHESHKQLASPHKRLNRRITVVSQDLQSLEDDNTLALHEVELHTFS